MTTIFNPNAQGNAEAEMKKAQEAFAKAAEANQAIVLENRNAVTADGNYKKYKNALPSCNYIFKDGTTAVFKSGEYLTNNPIRIAELDTEVMRGHPHIFIDPKDNTVTPEDMDPEKRERNKWFAVFQKEQEAAANRDMGETDRKSDLNVANSKDLAPAMANGAGALSSVPASLMAALQTQSGAAPLV